MEFTTCYCPNPQCPHYGKRDGTHLVHRGADRGIPRLRCTKCKGTFSARQGTAYFGVHAAEPNYTIAMRAWQKVIPCGVPAASSRSIRIPSVTGSIEPGGIAGPSPPICSTTCISPSANWTNYGASCARKKRISP